MKIYCDSFEEWTKTIAAMVREGVTFKAYVNETAQHYPPYTIELTGGY